VIRVTYAQSCTYPHAVLNQSACEGSYNSTEFVERVWTSDDGNFDNVLNAMQVPPLRDLLEIPLISPGNLPEMSRRPTRPH
jgi:hypothetical protein